MLKRRANGIYYFKKVIRGVRYERSLGTRNKHDAERAASDLLRSLYSTAHEWSPPKPLSVADAWSAFFSTLRQRSASTQKSFQRVYVHHVQPFWDSRNILSITSEDCRDYVNRRLKEGAAPGTVKTERQLLKSFFNRLVELKKIPASPWTVRQGIPTEPRIRVLSEAEEALLVTSPLAPIFRLFLLTGMRVKELLQVDASDLLHGPQPGLRVFGKGKKWRVIPLNAEGEALAAKLLPLRLTHSQLAHRVQDCRRKLNIQPFTLHDLRRTFGTRCAERDIPLKKLSMIMGHSNVLVTAKYYTHVRDPELHLALFPGGSSRDRGEKQVKTLSK